MPNETRHNVAVFADGPKHFPTFAEGIHTISRYVSNAAAWLDRIEGTCHHVTSNYQGRTIDGFATAFPWMPASEHVEAWKFTDTVTVRGVSTGIDTYTLVRAFPHEVVVLQYATSGGGDISEFRYLARLAFGEVKPRPAT